MDEMMMQTRKRPEPGCIMPKFPKKRCLQNIIRAAPIGTAIRNGIAWLQPPADANRPCDRLVSHARY
jgi:hypothetical protein